MDKIRLIDAINSSKLDYNDIYDKVNVIKKKKSNFNIESYNEIVYLQMYIYHLKNGINTLSKNGNIPELIPKRISYEQFKIELEKYKNIEYKNEVISEIKNTLNNVGNIGKKTILDYCEKNGIIKYKGKVFIEADDNSSYAIIYDNIDAVVSDEKGDLFIPNLVQNIFNGNNYGTVNQTNNIDNLQDKFFDIVLEKLDVMKIESKLDDKKIKEIRESCRKKDKNKVISFLKEIAMGTGTNLIATGILAMFGLM